MKISHLSLFLILSLFLMGTRTCYDDYEIGCSGIRPIERSVYLNKNLSSSTFSTAIFFENLLIFINFNNEDFSDEEIIRTVAILRNSIESFPNSLLLSNQDLHNKTKISLFSHFTGHFQICYVYLYKTNSLFNSNSYDVNLSLWHYNTGLYIGKLTFPAYFIDSYSLLFLSKLADELQISTRLQAISQ